MTITPEAVGIAGIAVVFLGVVFAMIIDYTIYRKNQVPEGVVKIYRPDLRIWGAGFFAGAGAFACSLFSYTIQRIILTPPHINDLWPALAPLFFLTAVIGLLAWGLVVLCQSE